MALMKSTTRWILYTILATLPAWIAVAVLHARHRHPAPQSRAVASPVSTQPAAPDFPRDYFAYDPTESPQAELNGLLGKPPPPLTVTGWVNGEPKPADMKGSVVLIDIWSTYCVPCIQYIPRHNEIYARYKSRGLVWIAVCTDTGQERFESTIERHKPTYPLCKDPALATRDAFHVSFFPTYVLIDRKGIVRAAGIVPEKLEDAVRKLIEEK
jgi:hypothetical protein